MMLLEGRVWKDGRTWLAEIPVLDVMTQGRSRRDALAMIIDAVEALVNHADFRLEVSARARGEAFTATSTDVGRLMALALRRQRQASGLSIAEVAKRLHFKSRSQYARYELGTTTPSLERFRDLIAAVAPNHFELLIRRQPTATRPTHRVASSSIYEATAVC